MDIDQQHLWSSHLPALMGCVAATKGMVLEIGVGHFSTPVLHAVLGIMNRQLVSVENDSEWSSTMSGLFDGEHHRLIFTGDYRREIAQLIHQKWSVVLIDHFPAGKARADSFQALLPASEFIIVHDYHDETLIEVSKLITSNVKHHVCKMFDPPTLVASLTHDIPHPILNL